MGNICGKQEPDSFATPGRRLGSTPTPATTAPVPQQQQRQPQRAAAAAGRTLGGASEAGGADTDAGRRAAAAAEARAQRKQPGKLGAQLEAQKKLTDREALQEASSAERRQRELDASVQALRGD